MKRMKLFSVISIVIVIAAFASITTSCNREAENKSEAVKIQKSEIELLMDEKARIAADLQFAADAEAKLKNDLRELEKKEQEILGQFSIVQEKDAEIASLRKALEAKKKSTTSTAQLRKCQKELAASKEQTEILKKHLATAVGLNPDASTSATLNRIPSTGGNMPAVEFCIHLGAGKYWPHIAIDRGTNFAEAVRNGPGTGFNLKVSNRTSDLTGDYGVTEDGTIYAKATQLEPFAQAGAAPEIIADMTGWQLKSMTKTGDYYIWHQ